MRFLSNSSSYIWKSSIFFSFDLMQIYREMKRLDVSKNIIMKVLLIRLYEIDVYYYVDFILNLLPSNCFRIIICFRCDCTGFWVFFLFCFQISDTTHGAMHLIGSHLYASYDIGNEMMHSTMYFFFFYFLTEINPLSILLISTYIRPHANHSKPPPTTQNTYSAVSSPRMDKPRMSVQSIFNRGKRNGSDSEYQSVFSVLILSFSFCLINHKLWIYSCRLSLVQKRECNICWMFGTRNEHQKEFNT